MQKLEKKKEFKSFIIPIGIIKIKTSLNTIFVTLTDYTGNVLFKESSGSLAFRGKKKKTPYVASEIVQKIFKHYKESPYIIKLFIIEFLGISKLNYGIIKNISKMRLSNIIYLNYRNNKSHNGVRKKKQRRL